MSLTDTAIRNAKPLDKSWKLSDAQGLYLLIKPNGSKLWHLKYRFGGKEKKLAFGAYPAVSLANARKLGDRLIVAVNSDASTKRLKGDSRPVNPLEQRMIVLGALEAVDWVVSFEEDTPQRLIAGILPDLLVKGGDYKPEEIAGSKEVWANGGEVLVLNFEDGCSTTNIIKKIQQDKKG